jgi:hypothetical protein
MVDEMLVAQAKWLPQYAETIPAARARLADPKVATRDWTGAAWREVRSVEELRKADAARAADAAVLRQALCQAREDRHRRCRRDLRSGHATEHAVRTCEDRGRSRRF